MGAFTIGQAAPVITGGSTSSTSVSPVSGAQTSDPYADKITTEKEAAHFLRQATLGVTYPEIQEVVALGSRRRWLMNQINSRFTGTGYAEWTVNPGLFTDATMNPGWLGTIAGKLRPPETVESGSGPDPAQPGITFTNRMLLTAMLRNRPQVTAYTDATGAVWQDPGASLLMKCVWVLNKFIPVSFPGGGWDSDNRPLPIASWYSMLSLFAFRNYKDLLREVTFHPAMTRMLTHIKNRKTDPNGGANQPDENYAREIMQLFTIGLYELNMDGTLKLDAQGNPIETYDNEDVLAFSRLFTGLTRWDSSDTVYVDTAYVNATADGNGDLISAERQHFAGTGFTTESFNRYAQNGTRWMPARCVPYWGWMDTGPIYALDGFVNLPELPRGDTSTLFARSSLIRAMQDRFHLAVDRLVEHPNTAPFVAKNLIKHMITSNPSPAYVERVARVFANNGRGIVGDMAAVWIAILTDAEAAQTVNTSSSHGRVRDGFEMFANMVRSFDRTVRYTQATQTASDSIYLPSAGGVPTFTDGTGLTHLVQTTQGGGTMLGNFGAWPYMSPSIFGYYSPDYSAQPARDWDVLTPELGSMSAATKMLIISQLQTRFCLAGHPTGATGTDILTSQSYTTVLGATAATTAGSAGAIALVDRLDLLLCGGTLEQTKKDEIVAAIAAPGQEMPVATAANQESRVNAALQMIIRATEFWVM